MELINIAYIATISASIIALSSLAFSSYKSLKNTRLEEIREWQRVVIFKTLEDGNLTKKQIDAEYGRKAQEIENIPLREIKEDAVIREILRLQADGIIQRNPDETFSLRAETHSSLRDELMKALIQRGEMSDKMMFAEHAIVKIIRDKPKLLEEDSIFLELKNQNSVEISQHEFGYLLRNLEMRRIVVRDDKNKYKIGNPSIPKTISKTTTKTMVKRPSLINPKKDQKPFSAK